jgi:aminomethyltransferase
MKKTALYEEHVRLGARIVEFGGWQMPVQYSGLALEHKGCRERGGLFDVSHMGELRVSGAKALSFLNTIVSNDLRRLIDGQAQYNIMCNSDGGCVDDIIVHRESENNFFICVNASNTEKDFEWVKSRAPQGVVVENESSKWSQIALQGRIAPGLLTQLTGKDYADLKYYHFAKAELMGGAGYIARTGYTGEDGFELYIPWDHGPKVWRKLLELGSEKGLVPCGLGARDTLRTEMKFPLYGHEIDEHLNPLDAGLGWAVKLDKDSFIGRDPLLQYKNKGVSRSLVGLVSQEKAIPRQGYEVHKSGIPGGVVTSGTLSPTLNTGIAIAYVPKEWSEKGTVLDVMIRGTPVKHVVSATPFYKRNY